jgi:signal transduction histidine kinase
MGTSVAVVSELGQGTRFTVTVPAKPPFVVG